MNNPYFSHWKKRKFLHVIWQNGLAFPSLHVTHFTPTVPNPTLLLNYTVNCGKFLLDWYKHWLVKNKLEQRGSGFGKCNVQMRRRDKKNSIQSKVTFEFYGLGAVGVHCITDHPKG